MILGRCLCLALLLAGWGCIEEAKPIRGIQTRLYVDRTEATLPQGYCSPA